MSPVTFTHFVMCGMCVCVCSPQRICDCGGSEHRKCSHRNSAATTLWTTGDNVRNVCAQPKHTHHTTRSGKSATPLS